MTTLHSFNVMNAALAGGFGNTRTREPGPARRLFARVARLGTWFRRTDDDAGSDDGASHDAIDLWSGIGASSGVSDPFSIPTPDTTGLGGPRGPRLLGGWRRRPSSRRRQAEGMNALAAVMRDVRDQMEQQTARQDELLRCVLTLPQVLEHLPESQRMQVNLLRTIGQRAEQQTAHQAELLRCLQTLPQVLEQIPETQRLQIEVLSAMGQRVERQTSRQDQIAALLERMAKSDAERGRALDAVVSGVEDLGRRDEAIAGVVTGAVVDAIGRGSEAGARAVEQLRADLAARDGQWERVLQRHNVRFTGLLAIATALSVAALTAVAVMGYVAMAR